MRGLRERCAEIQTRLLARDPGAAATARAELGALLARVEADLAAGEGDAELRFVFAYAAGLDAVTADARDNAAVLARLRTARAAHPPDGPLAPWLDYLLAARLWVAGDADAAAATAERALERGPAPPFDLHTRALLGSLLCAVGRWDEALAVLDGLERRLAEERAQTPTAELARELDRAESTLWSTRAQIEQELGVPDRAAALVDQAELLARASGHPDAVAEALCRRADLDLLTERFAAVESAMRDALADPAAGFAPAQRAQFRVYLGAARLDLAAREPGREEDGEADLAAAIDDPALPARERLLAATGLCDLYLRRGDVERAAAVAAVLRNGDAGAAGSRAMTQLARLALAAGADPSTCAAELAYLEQSYARLLASIARLPPRPGGLGFLHARHRRQLVATLIALALRAEPGPRGVERALELVLRAQATGSLTRRTGASALVTVADLRRELLRDGHGALVYLPARDETHLFAVDRETLVHEVIPRSFTGLRALLGPIREVLSRSPESDERMARRAHALRAAAARASDVLLPAPVRARLARWDAVTVSGTEMMLDVPFEVLLDGEGGFLGRRVAIASLSSLPLGAGLARRAASRRASPLSIELFATLRPDAPPADAHVDPAAFGPADALRLTRAFAADRRHAVLGPAFTAEALRARDLRKVSVLHLLAHGYYDVTRERGAALLVARGREHDAVLRCEDVDALRFAGLAVLSACGSGRGPARFGDDGPAHLGGAFLWAGARAVVLSHSALHYEQSMQLLEDFYRELVAGQPPAEALRRARCRADGDDPWLQLLRVQLQVLGLGHVPLR